VPWGQALTQRHKPFPGALRVLQLPNVLWAYIAVLMAGSLGRSTAAAAHKRRRRGRVPGRLGDRPPPVNRAYPCRS
jgi:hypothetical protein